MALLTPNQLRAMLPAVGDRRMETPTLHKMQGVKRSRPQPCVVTHVNEEHYWYEVTFANGVRETYKLPTDDMLHDWRPEE